MRAVEKACFKLLPVLVDAWIPLRFSFEEFPELVKLGTNKGVQFQSSIDAVMYIGSVPVFCMFS